MTYRQLVSLLYNENAPRTLVELGKAIPDTTLTFKQSPDIDPKQDGEYLVHHAQYGWCTYGFTIKDRWGEDDAYIDQRGALRHKISLWTDLSFLKEQSENTSSNV